MKKSVALALTTLLLIAFIGISAIGFYSNFGDDTIMIKDLIWTGINLIFALAVTCISIQIFVIWIFVDQLGKHKLFIDNINDKLSAIESNIELLL